MMSNWRTKTQLKSREVGLNNLEWNMSRGEVCFAEHLKYIMQRESSLATFFKSKKMIVNTQPHLCVHVEARGQC